MRACFVCVSRRYHAPFATQERWKAMDPLNVFNPGVGGLPITKGYAASHAK